MDKILFSNFYYKSDSKFYVVDDEIDRLNNRRTVRLLVLCITIVVGSLYFGKAISCWTPAEFKGTHDSYANMICWLRGTYYLPTEEIIIPDRSQPREDFVAYYQWTGFILLGMAILFLIPRIFWINYLRQQGIHLAKLINSIHKEKEYSDAVEKASSTLENYIKRSKNRKSQFCGFLPVKNGITATYIAIKIYYIVNSLGQFLLLNIFLSFNFFGYGWEVLQNRLNANEHYDSRRFPRVTMCDFMVRRLGSNQHWYAVQCTLPINLYNEWIFLIIWFWLIILTILNIFSLITAIINSFNNQTKVQMKDFLEIDLRDEKHPKWTPDNTNKLLRSTDNDTLLLVNLISKNTDSLTMARILQGIHLP